MLYSPVRHMPRKWDTRVMVWMVRVVLLTMMMVLVLSSIHLTVGQGQALFLTVNGKVPISLGNGVYAVGLDVGQPVEMDVILTNASGKVTVAVELIDPIITLESGNGSTLVHSNMVSFSVQGTVIIRVLGLAPGQGLLMSVITPNGALTVINNHNVTNGTNNSSILSLITYLHGISGSSELALALVALIIIMIIGRIMA